MTTTTETIELVPAAGIPTVADLEAWLADEARGRCELCDVVRRLFTGRRERDCQRSADWIAHLVRECSGHERPAVLMCDMHLTRITTGLQVLICHVCHGDVDIRRTEWLR